MTDGEDDTTPSEEDAPGEPGESTQPSDSFSLGASTTGALEAVRERVPGSLAELHSLALGSAPRTAVTVLLSILLLTVGAYAAGVIGAPEVVAADNGFTTVNNSTTVIETELTVSNPNPVAITLGSVTLDYTVYMNDIDVADGHRTGVSLGEGNSTVALETVLENEKITAWWPTHIERDEQSRLTVDATVDTPVPGVKFTRSPVDRPIETDLLGQFNSSSRHRVESGTDALDPVAFVEQRNATWGNTSSAETPMNVEFVVYNPNTRPVVMTDLGYNITMNEVMVGEGATNETYTIPGGATRTVQTQIAIANPTLDDWWVSHLRANQTTELQIRFAANFDVSNLTVPGTPDTVSVPLKALTYNKTFDTEIFGGGGARWTPDSSPPSTGTADSEPTSGSTEKNQTTDSSVLAREPALR